MSLIVNLEKMVQLVKVAETPVCDIALDKPVSRNSQL